MAQRAGADLHRVLQDCNLLEYEPLLLEEGADDVSQLKELDEEEFRQLCLMVGMASKPFHVKRLQKALGRPSSQIYSAKLMGAPTITSSSQLLPSGPLQSNPGPIFPGAVGGPPRSVAVTTHPPVSRLQPLASNSARPHPTPHPRSSGDPYQSQQLLKLPPQKQKPLETASNNKRVSGTSPSFSPEAVQPTGEVPPRTSYHQPQEQEATATEGASSSSKQLFLPPYLQPDSDARDLSFLVDELTPIQAELGPCPFKPSNWDDRRTELVRRYSAIYGQGNSKRKNEELSLHEENINTAAFQLCLRDPTLLVRRDELLVLSRKAIRDGGYAFQHSLSKAKAATTSETLLPTSSSSSSLSAAHHKQQEETLASLVEGGNGAGFPPADVSGGLLPPPRNMSREMKLKRVEELEFLITKNKMRQSIKLAALEKARQANDFSMSHHLQAEIESLGNTLANLQDEYSNMKYRLRRSDRYFEKKRRLDERVDGLTTLPSRRPTTSLVEVVPKRTSLSNTEVSPKRICTKPDFDSSGVAGEQLEAMEFYTPLAHHDEVGERDRDKPRPPITSTLATDYLSSHLATGSASLGNTTVSFSRSYFRVAPTVTSTDTLSPSSLLHTSPSLGDRDAAHNNTRPAIVGEAAPRHRGGSSSNDTEEGEEDSTNPSSSRHDRDDRESLVERDKALPSSQLLANINKLATQAAANLRSLPHF